MNLTEAGTSLGRALGHIDEFFFVDALMRKTTMGETDEVPAGCSVVVAGWALNPAPPRLADALRAMVGRQHMSELSYGHERLDVGRAMSDQSLSAAGFKQVLSLDGLPVGPHSLRIIAIDAANSGYYELGDERKLVIVESRRLFPGTSAVEGRMQFGIERLETTSGRQDLDGKTLRARIGDIVVASGWVIDRDRCSIVGDVFGVVDDDHYTLAVSGMPRAEIAASLGLPAQRSCGFTLRIPTRTLSAGTHDLSLIAVARGGSDYERVSVGFLDLR